MQLIMPHKNGGKSTLNESEMNRERARKGRGVSRHIALIEVEGGGNSFSVPCTKQVAKVITSPT